VWSSLVLFLEKHSSFFEKPSDDLLGPDDDDDDDDYNEDAPYDLPAPNLKNLVAIKAILLTTSGPYQKERVAAAVLKTDFIKKLCDVFQIAEDMESKQDLHNLFDIFKQLGTQNADLAVVFRNPSLTGLSLQSC
jgi:hypothetical protein